MSQMLTSPELPDRCELQHKIFTALGAVRFRRATTDGVPMMALQLGEREAVVPLDALRREFAIGKDSADGRMLDLIGSALDFVTCVEPGDRLPPEICTGEASWRPSPNHLRLASTRLRLDLVGWIQPTSRWAKAEQDDLNLLRLADDAALHAEVHAVARAVAVQLGLRDAGDVLGLLAELSQELAYIEALRERLQARVIVLCQRLGRLMQDRKRLPVSFTALPQVHRLAKIAAVQIIGRFDEVTAQTGEIASLLRNVDNQRSFIRANRDWLYRTQRAWEPLLDEWSRAKALEPEEMGPLLTSTYQFLAQRSLPGETWQRPRPARSRKPVLTQMTW